MWSDWLSLGNKYLEDLVKKEKSSAKKEKLKNFFSKTNGKNGQDEISLYKYNIPDSAYDLTYDNGFFDIGYLPSTQGVYGVIGNRGARGNSGYISNYLSEEVDRSIEYSEYIAEEVEGSIRHSDYLIGKLDYSYYEEYSPDKYKIPCLVNKFNLEANQVYESDVCYFIINKVFKNNLLDMYCPKSVYVTEEMKNGYYVKKHGSCIECRVYFLNDFESKISKGEIWISK